jgi:hypothetical protein
VEADSSLRGEVEYAGVGVGAVVLLVVGRAAEGWVFVIGPEETAGSLSPEGDAASTRKVPAEDDRGDRGSCEGAADGVESGALLWRADRISAERALELWRVGLPEGEGFDGVFEVAAESAVADGAGEDLAGVDSSQEELEAAAVVGDAVAALDEDAEVEGLVAGGVVEGRRVVGDGGLGGGWKSGEETESQECECADALQISDH